MGPDDSAGDGARRRIGEERGDHHGLHVPVDDVGQFIGQNRFKLVPGQGSDKAASGRDSRSSDFSSLWVVSRSRPAGRIVKSRQDADSPG